MGWGDGVQSARDSSSRHLTGAHQLADLRCKVGARRWWDGGSEGYRASVTAAD